MSMAELERRKVAVDGPEFKSRLQFIEYVTRNSHLTFSSNEVLSRFLVNAGNPIKEEERSKKPPRIITVTEYEDIFGKTDEEEELSLSDTKEESTGEGST